MRHISALGKPIAFALFALSGFTAFIAHTRVLGFAAPDAAEARSPSSSPHDAKFALDPHKDIVIEFKDHGVVVARLTKSQLLEKLAPVERHLYDFLDSGDAKDVSPSKDPRYWLSFGLLPANEVLDLVYGSRWRSVPKIAFTCVDNYKPWVPVSRFLTMDGHFAAWRTGDPTFTIRNRVDGDQTVPAGPLYLTWERMEAPEVLADGKYRVPYQVMGLDLVDADYGESKVAFDASAAAKRGAQAFSLHCASCHSVEGDGRGERKRDLTYASDSYVGRWGVLAQKIRDPELVTPGSTMTPLRKMIDDLAKLEATTTDLIEYLKQVTVEARARKVK